MGITEDSSHGGTETQRRKIDRSTNVTNLVSGTLRCLNGNFTLQGFIQMIHINKIFLLFFFCTIFNCTQNKPDMNIISSEERIIELVNIIKNNLSGTSVLELFLDEQEKWVEYKNSRIKTLYPEYVDGIKVPWGSILSYSTSKTVLEMNLERIKVLEDFLYIKNETGTDGEGRFIEYIEEFKLIFQSQIQENY